MKRNLRKKKIEIRKFRKKLNDIYEIFEPEKYMTYTQDIEEVRKRIEDLKDIKGKYTLLSYDGQIIHFANEINVRLHSFLLVRDKILAEIEDEDFTGQVDLKELEKFYNLRVETANKEASQFVATIVEGITVDLISIQNEVNMKVMELINNKVKKTEIQSLKNLTGFFFVFTLIVSNITVIKGLGDLNIYFIISLVFIINSVSVFAVISIFRTIGGERKRHNRTLWWSLFGMCIGIIVLIVGALTANNGVISERILDKKINIKIEEVNKEIDELDIKIRSLEDENKNLRKK